MCNIHAYIEEYDTLSYTPQQKAALAAKAVSAARQKKAPRFGRLLRFAAVAACLLCVITVTAEAAGIPTPVSQLLAPFFGKSAAQCEIIDTIGRPVDAKDTDNGVSIQADAIMGDAHNVSILFTIRREDGTPLLPAGVNAGQLYLGDGSDVTFDLTGGLGANAEFIDTVPGDQEIQLLYKLSASSRLLGETCTAVFDGLYYWDSVACASKAAVAGHWKLQFEMDYEDSALTLECGQVFTQDGMTITIQEVFVSPIAIHVSYDVDAPVQSSPGSSLEEMEEAMKRFESIPILLTKTDGTAISKTASCSTTFLPGDGITHVYRSTAFDSVLPLEEVASITVGDIVFPIG